MSRVDTPRVAAPAESPRPRRTMLALAAGCVLAAGYLAVAGVVALVFGTSGSGLSVPAVLSAALPGWLAAYQVPLVMTGGELAVLPLLPTAFVVVTVAAVSAEVARREGLCHPRQARPVILTMALTHAVCGAALALLLGESISVRPVDAFLNCGVLAGLSATAGVAGRCGLVAVLAERVPAEVWFGLRAGLLALAGAVGAGALTTLVGLVFSVTQMRDLFASMGTAGDAVGSAVLCVLYMPNAAVAGWAVASGSGLSLGGFAAAPWQLTHARLPEFPLLASLPASGPSPWWLMLLVLPLAVGVLVGYSCRDVWPSHRWRVVGVAGLVASLGVLLLATLVSGRAGGAFALDLRPPLLAAVTFGWVVVPAGVVAWLVCPQYPYYAVEPEEPASEPEGPAEPESPAEPEVVPDPPAEAPSADPEQLPDVDIAEFDGEQIEPG